MLVSVNIQKQDNLPEVMDMDTAKSNTCAVALLPLAEPHALAVVPDVPDPASTNNSSPLLAISVDNLCIIDPDLIIKDLEDINNDGNTRITMNLFLDHHCFLAWANFGPFVPSSSPPSPILVPNSQPLLIAATTHPARFSHAKSNGAWQPKITSQMNELWTAEYKIGKLELLQKAQKDEACLAAKLALKHCIDLLWWKCHIPNFHLRIPSLTELDRAPLSITASPKYSDSA